MFITNAMEESSGYRLIKLIYMYKTISSKDSYRNQNGTDPNLLAIDISPVQMEILGTGMITVGGCKLAYTYHVKCT